MKWKMEKRRIKIVIKAEYKLLELIKELFGLSELIFMILYKFTELGPVYGQQLFGFKDGCYCCSICGKRITGLRCLAPTSALEAHR